MQLGAKGVLDLMNSMGGLPSASKFWSAGDKVLYAFPVEGLDESGIPKIPVAFRYGHSVELGDTFKRSFLPTKSEMDPLTQQITKPDFAYQSSSIFRALLEGEKARRIETIKRDVPQESAQKIELANLEEDMKKRFPAVGYLNVRAYSEVAVAKLDTNGRIAGGEVKFDYGSIQISKKKLGQLIQRATEQGAYRPGDNYFYVVMQTNAGDKKQAGQVDWMAVTDPAKRLEELHPDFNEKLTALMKSKSPTEDTIAAKIYDFKDYDLDEFKTAVANYVNERTYMLKDLQGEYHEFVRNERNMESLKSLGLVADAEKIKAYLNTEDNGLTAESAQALMDGNEAQTIDLSNMETVTN